MIVYPAMMECLNRWLAAHFGDADPISSVALRVTGEFNDMRGALAMVEGDLGLTVMAKHVAMTAMANGRVREVQRPADSSATVARQQIFIIRLKDRRMPARVKRVIRWFLDMHVDLQPVPEEFLQ
jgi:DNA-binding transcriptional LysR family regulator